MKFKSIYLLGILMWMQYGCNSVSESEFKKEDLYGAWTTPSHSLCYIYTDNYGLVIYNSRPNPPPPTEKDKIVIRMPPPAKYKYYIIKNSGIHINNARLKRDSKGFYLDYTPSWFDYIPSWLEVIPYIINPSLDNIGTMRKISDEEAIKYLKKAGITKEQVFSLPIKDSKDTNISIPDASAPEIFDKLK